MSYLDDPRVFFAAERTLLAWVRTGITISTFGFVVAKFGVFLRYIDQHGSMPAAPTHLGTIIGMLLVILGAACCLAAAVQFRRFAASLTGAEVPPRWSMRFPVMLSYAIGGTSLLLAAYLFVSA